ncbi:MULTISPECIES: hypothetical protein [Acinetobacter]|uniref:Uncharacterized protein n=1 Tax=Acinetobacter higginsii TaxID=70347 RepID=N9T5Q5_9GAMM|nr:MULTISPECIES: hypothetical protein [Acinetobacter]ENX58750.1 hypothetical protein F902_01377 [Acinetobacter higginsii]
MIKREVTEFDLRCPEFQNRDLKPEHFEFRDDGKIVRKDRWERGIYKIHGHLCGLFDFSSRKDFELDDIVKAIEKLTDEAKEATADAEET